MNFCQKPWCFLDAVAHGGNPQDRAASLLRSLVEKAEKTHSEDSSSLNPAEFDKTIAAYQVISKKYKNALRELARVNEPLWISEEIVRVIHRDQIQQHGGRLGIRDENLLSASLARPRHLFVYGQPNLFELAAASGYSLVKNHPFIDGNKRIAFAGMATFY